MSDVEISQIGHLASNPELTYVGEGDARVARASLLVISNRRRRDKVTGEIKERVTRVPWTVWRAQAENALKHLAKGSHVAISGRLENNDYEKDGEDVYSYNHVAEDIEYLDSKAEAAARAARSAARDAADEEGALEETATGAAA
jgi:single stranded DNA-binding protein